MAIANEIADGLTEIEGDFPATFVWNSTSYACMLAASRAVKPATLVWNTDASLVVQTSNLAKAPTGRAKKSRLILGCTDRNN